MSSVGYIEDAERNVVGFGGDDFSVRVIDRDTANATIRANHYSKKVYNASYIHLGVFASGEMLGVLQFGYAMNPASMASVVADTAKDEYLELNRMWLSDSLPRNSESRAISFALKFIKRRYPRIAWIQSFADERCQRFGVVYQAANFLYCGEHTATFWLLDGVWYHNIIATCKPGTKRGDGPVCVWFRENKHRATKHRLRQFRYIYFLKPAFRQRLRKPVRPYPKPNASEVSTETRRETIAEGLGRFQHDALFHAAIKGNYRFQRV